MKVFTVIIVLFLNYLCLSQVTSGAETINKFIYGSHIQSSANDSFTNYNNYWLVKNAGFNFPYQTTKLNIPGYQSSNADSLKTLDYIVSGNTMIRQYTDHEKNIDHIYYYTNALYKKWEYNDPLFPNPNDTVSGLIKGTNTQVDANGNLYLLKNHSSSGSILVKGPNYAQYKRYMYTNCLNMTNDVVKYIANFYLKINNVVNSTDTVCIINVKVRDYNQNGEITTVATKYVRVNNFNLNQFMPIDLKYDLGIFSPDTTTPNDQSHFDEKLKVFYEVLWTNKSDLYLDYIEVYDEKIYDYYFRQYYGKMVDTIKMYNDYYIEDGFYPNLKFFGTLDEPHGLDAFTPIGIIQGIIDSLRNQGKTIADLYSHAYPNYSGKTDGHSTFKLFTTFAKPKVLSFWYFPYEVGVSDIDALYHYVNTILPEAHINHPDFYVAVQSWGQISSTGQVFGYRIPTEAELSAQIMATLSFGAKGILIEPFYDHNSWIAGYGDFTVTGIVDLDYNPKPLFNKVKEIGTRLNGKLGETLLGLNFTGNIEGVLINYYDQIGVNKGIEAQRYIKLSWPHPMVDNCYHYVSFFEPKNQNLKKKFFFATNLLTNNTAIFDCYITNPYQEYKNIRLKDIEGGIDETCTFQIPTITFHKDFQIDTGDGRLFTLAPVRLYGGNLIISETIGAQSIETLEEDVLRIKSGCKLTVKGKYFIKKNIIVEVGGMLEILGQGKIITQGAHIVVLGSLLVKGEELSSVILEFGQSLEDGITIESDTAVTIENAVFKGGAGLFFNDVKGVVTIKNCRFENCNTAISVNNLREVLIVNNKFINCANSIYSSNVGTIEVNRNEMISNLGTMPGIFLNSSFGNIRKNTIEGFSDGIVLGHSSVSLAENIIKNNYFHGLVLSSGVFVNMKLFPAGESGELYTYGGFNKIYNNGFDPYSDGSEITITDAEMELEYGYNCIFDERNDPVMAENLIIDPTISSNPRIDGSYNSWGNNNQFLMSDRFDYTNFSSGNIVECVYPVFTQSNGIINTMGDGSVIDSLYPLNFAAVNELLGMEALFNAAELQYIAGNYETARTMYMDILDDFPDERGSLKIYTRLFTIQNNINSDTYSFDDLSLYYSDKVSTVANNSLKDCLTQLISLCSVSSGYLESAIADFNAIIETDPLSEAALFAAIDKYTTELLAPEVGLGKGFVKISTDKYAKQVGELVLSKFGRKVSKDKTTEIPQNYSLSQNYPNPFNPETVIKFSILESGKVKLTVYDILGREIKTLVNEHKEAGVYNIRFNAGSLSSGVYIYKIETEKFTDIKKMMFIK